MPRHTTLIGITATLLAGDETTELLKTLGLVPGTFFFQRRSNARPDLQDIYRVLHHGLTGWTFPDLDWVIEGTRKTIIYCATFAICLHLCVYYHYKAPQKIVRIYNSLCFPTYNADTQRLFVEDCNTQIILATDALVVGIDFPNVEDVIDLDCKHPNHGKQCKGWAGRPGGNVKDPRGITYVTKTTMERAKKMVEKQPFHNGGKWVDQGLHIGMARLLIASCHSQEDDILYDNPPSDPSCSCNTCIKQPSSAIHICKCSACVPETPLPPLLRATQTLPSIPVDLRLTETMIRQGTTRLQEFCREIWHEKRRELGFLPPVALLPDLHIKNLLDNFARLKASEDLTPYIHNLYLCSGNESRLFSIISELRDIFATLPQWKKASKSRPLVTQVSASSSSR